MPETEADTAALLFQFLSAFGNAAGPGAHYRVEDTKHPARLFEILCGDSAVARKGTSLDRVKAFYQGVDVDWVGNIKSGLASGKGLIHHVRDPREETDKNGETKVVDDGVPDKRLLAVCSEFASLLSVMERPGNTLSPLLREAWDSGNLQI